MYKIASRKELNSTVTQLEIVAAKYFLNPRKPSVNLGIVFTGISFLLVGPVRHNAFLGYVIHTAGPYLDLHPEAGMAHQRAVQGFVPVALGEVYPVAVPSGVSIVYAHNL